MHEFGWGASDYDLLAAGSLVGHIIECGCQATGGLFTDWEAVPDWANIGYPIAECRGDGTFRITKPAGTGGLDPRAARSPSSCSTRSATRAPTCCPTSICDFRQVTHRAGRRRSRPRRRRARHGADRHLQGLGDGAGTAFAAAGTLVIVGIDAVKKAERTGAAIVERTSRLLREAGFADFTATHVEVIGAESSYGPHARTRASREVMLRVVADHADRRALELFAREIAPAGHVVVAGDDRARRRPAGGVAARQAVLVPARQARGAGVVRDRRAARRRSPSRRGGGGAPRPAREDVPLPRTSDGRRLRGESNRCR